MNRAYKFVLFSVALLCAHAGAQGLGIPQTGSEVGAVEEQVQQAPKVQKALKESSVLKGSQFRQDEGDTGEGNSSIDSITSDQQMDGREWDDQRMDAAKSMPNTLGRGDDRGRDNYLNHIRIQRYCRAYASEGRASTQNCRSIAEQAYSEMDSLTRDYIDGQLGKCRNVYNDRCLLKRLELNALIQSARHISRCGQATMGYNPSVARPLFDSSVRCSLEADFTGQRRVLSFYTLDYKQVMNAVFAARPTPFPPEIVRPYRGGDLDQIRPTDRQFQGLSTGDQDVGASH